VVCDLCEVGEALADPNDLDHLVSQVCKVWRQQQGGTLEEKQSKGPGRVTRG
jgi:hypothetical protein